MIDFVKVRTAQTGLAASLRRDPRLNWIPHVNEDHQQTGHKATHHALTFYVFSSGIVEVAGSLHKCWNSLSGNETHNRNDFRRLDLFDTLHWLTHEFSVSLSLAMVRNVEVGVNLTLPPAPPTVRELLDRLLYYGNGKTIDRVAIRGGGFAKRLDLSNFYVKAYDKGTAATQRLRFEKGITVMKELNPKGVPPLLRTLADLTRAEVLAELGKSLLKTFDGCFWQDVTDLSTLTPAELDTVTKAHHPPTWATLTRQQRGKLKTRYDRIANRQTNRLRADLRQRIADKLSTLLEAEGDIFHKGVRPTQKGPLVADGDIFHKGGKTEQRGHFPHSDKGGKCPLSPQPEPPSPPTAEAAHRCAVTGLAIAHQRGRKVYVSALSVRRLYDDDRPTFDRLAAEFLSRKQAGATLDKQCYHIAHNVRNRRTNLFNNTRRNVCRAIDDTPLFSAAEVVRPTALQQTYLDYWKGTRWEVGRG
jgi:hypothetical protein